MPVYIFSHFVHNFQQRKVIRTASHLSQSPDLALCNGRFCPILKNEIFTIDMEAKLGVLVQRDGFGPCVISSTDTWDSLSGRLNTSKCSTQA
jgi:hypothetical protein